MFGTASILSLVSYGFFGQGALGQLFNYWEQAGVFSYLLPFLILFSLIFVTLNNINLFEKNKAVSAVIALSVGLLAMQFDMVPMFFAELFPRVGVGLSILLAIFILMGLFLDRTQKWMKWGLFFVGFLILIFVLYDTGQFTAGYYLYYLLDPTILSWILFVVIIAIVVIAFSRKKQHHWPDTYPPLLYPLGQSRPEDAQG
jgi:hypothetical protein